MGGRRRLTGGFSVWLPDHRSAEGHSFRRYLQAAEEVTGIANGSQFLRVEQRRYAIAGVTYEQAARQHAELVHKREHGKGLRPNLRQVERAARRLGLADMTLREATTRLEALAAKARKAPSLAEYLSEPGA